MAIARVNIIGSGNVATFFAHYLAKKQVMVAAVYSNRIDNAKTLASTVNALAKDDLCAMPADVDLNIVCVKDAAILKIAEGLNKQTPVVHTSGSIDSKVFSSFSTYGVIYPVQTISKARVALLSGVPFLVEASSDPFRNELKQFVSSVFSTTAIDAASDQRSAVHLAAVFANNFSNFFLAKAEEILNRSNLDFGILKPLMTETVAKAFEVGPRNAQTGPALRGDREVMNSHLSRINDAQLHEIYRLISDQINKSANS